MKDTDFVLVVGARGWQRAGWAGSYYPADVPPEWRLAYYANEFTGVLVPRRDWLGASNAARRQWHDDTPAGFRFLIERDSGIPEKNMPSAAPLGAKFAGWVGCRDAHQPDCLTAALLSEPAADQADVALCRAADLEDRRALGRRLTGLAARRAPLLALIALEDVGPADLRELRLLAEVAGLA